VKDSETLKDIARREGIDAAELALINGKKQDEILPRGTRIQLPIY
jgi:LysM repeat protein